MEFSTVQEVNKHCRDLLLHSHTVGLAIEMWRDLAFQGKRLVLSGVPDQKSAEFFHDAVVGSTIERQLPLLLTDYMVFGRFAANLLWDVTKGYWGACIPLDVDYCSIKLLPTLGEPLVSVETTPEQQEWATSTDPCVVEQRDSLDPTLVQCMARGEAIQLKPMNTLFLARRAFASDFYGTSWLSNVGDAAHMRPAEILFKLQVQVSRLHDDADFQLHYVDAAARLRDRICDYVFHEKMFPFLAKQHGFTVTPTIEWADKKGAESPRSIVVRALERTGSALATLEAQQELLVCGEEAKNG